jgi:hypothetical protein
MVELNKDVISWLADQHSRIEHMLEIGESQENREQTFNDLMEIAQQFLELAKQLVAMSKLATSAAQSMQGDSSPAAESSHKSADTVADENS